jgi:heme exporter protein C
MRTVGPGLSAALAVAAVGFFAVPLLVLSAPTEPVMGLVQKIFYFHVPCAIMMFLSTFTAAGGSVAYLFKGSERGDRLAHAAGELGVLFGACVLVSGPLWGRKAWGVWWQWDARLTSSLLLFLILNGYLLARRYGGPGGRKLAAALALFAAVDVPLVYKSVDIWRTVHPHASRVLGFVRADLAVVEHPADPARAPRDGARRAGRSGVDGRGPPGEQPMTTFTRIRSPRVWSRLTGAALLLAGVLAAAAPALAQEFEKVDNATREQLPAPRFVGAAYGFIWFAILVYVFVVARGLARVSGEIEALRRRLDRSGGQGQAGPSDKR